ncbi:hypothetical protein [Alteromonas antoniana]|uniref:hypothetical protein n=1 Tax=Alteromonas antoniana TaxID=2803813 RepID=UPI001C45FE9C|nr:hypothetical protein [Alteromonas antoniana]
MRFVTQTALFSLLLSFQAIALQNDITADMNNDDAQKSSEHPVASSEFDLMDKNKDGVVTEQEASDIGVNNLFSDMDSNGDGVLSQKEYMNYRDEDTPQIREDF